MELRDLRYFCLAAETEHISQAAAQLGVSQPFMTKIITQLEDELGCELFDHVGRRIKLNRYGRLLYERASKILDNVDGIQKQFDSIFDNANHPIDIGVGSSAYCSDLPLKYKTAYPESTVNRIYFDRAALIEALKNNEVDFGICSPAISADEADDLNTEIVRDESAYLLAPVGHTISQQESVCVDDLNGLALITTLKGSDTRNNIDLYCAAHNVTPSIVYETIDNALIMKMVEDGMGCTIFAKNYVDNMPRSEKIRYLSITDASGSIGFSHNKKAVSTKATKQFAAFVRKYFSEL